MSDNSNDITHNTDDQLPGAQHEDVKTPLEAVKNLQREQQQHLAQAQELDKRPDATSEVPGQGPPSTRRQHPQRQMYGSGTNES